jgi:hypothetical protein
MTRLSRQGRDVLEALAQPRDGRLTIRRLVQRLQPRHGSPAITKASLSRTLRRLWQAGYVELENDWRVTLTETKAAAAARLAALEVGYEADYEVILARHLAGNPTCGFFPFSTATDYLEHQRWVLTRYFGKRNRRHTAAVLTPTGRERVSIDVTQRLTARRSQVNRKAVASRDNLSRTTGDMSTAGLGTDNPSPLGVVPRPCPQLGGNVNAF